jgi:hypothetical protein
MEQPSQETSTAVSQSVSSKPKETPKLIPKFVENGRDQKMSPIQKREKTVIVKRVINF